MPSPDPEYVLRVPRSVALAALAALGKGPLEQVLDPFTALRDQIVLNEERLRIAEATALVEGMKAASHGPDGLR